MHHLARAAAQAVTEQFTQLDGAEQDIVCKAVVDAADVSTKHRQLLVLAEKKRCSS